MSNGITSQALKTRMQRARHDWSSAVMRTCEFCDHYSMTVVVEGSATCANCCDAEYTSRLVSLLEQAADALESRAVKLPAVEKWRKPDDVRAQNAYRVLVVNELAAAGIQVIEE